MRAKRASTGRPETNAREARSCPPLNAKEENLGIGRHPTPSFQPSKTCLRAIVAFEWSMEPPAGIEPATC